MLKLVNYAAIIFLNITIFGLKMYQTQFPAKEILWDSYELGLMEQDSKIWLLYGIVLSVELVNVFCIIWARWLLIYEYRRLLSEEWYSHVMLIWLNFITLSLHLLLFFNLYSLTFTILSLFRIMLFFSLICLQCSTTKRTKGNWRPNEGVNGAVFEIKYSQSSVVRLNNGNNRSQASQSQKNSETDNSLEHGMHLNVLEKPTLTRAVTD